MTRFGFQDDSGFDPTEIGIVLAGYLVTLLLSGVIVRYFTPPPPKAEEAERPGPKGRFDASVVIGKCENILVVTLVLAGEVTGLALLFAAKSLVRKEDIRKNSQFYLGGMLVNLTWSLGMGYLTRYLAAVV